MVVKFLNTRNFKLKVTKRNSERERFWSLKKHWKRQVRDCQTQWTMLQTCVCIAAFMASVVVINRGGNANVGLE